MHPHSFRRTSCGLILWTCALMLLVAALPGTARAQGNAAGAINARSTAAAPTEATGILPEPDFLDHALTRLPKRFGLDDGDGGRAKNGFYPELSNMPTGAGWISLGPGFRHWLFADRALVDMSAALSWRSYKMAQARVELPLLGDGRLAVGSQVRWQDLTQVTFFGEGPQSRDENRSEYRIKSTNVLAYGAFRATDWLSVGVRAGWLSRPDILAPAGSFDRGYPDAREVFADDIVYRIDRQPTFIHREALLTADTRDHRSHPTTGGLYRAAMAYYVDGNGGLFDFRRYEAEAAHFVPLADARVVLAVRGWLVASNTAEGDVIPFYLQPSLGGGNTLRAYTDYRFHDRNMVVMNAEARVALFTHIDGAVFVDAGNVAGKVGDLNLDKRAYGVGFRMHTNRATFARLDIAHGDDGWRLLLRLSDPLHLSRLSRRTAAIPFVP